MTSKSWLGFALATTLMWGVWGAFTGFSAQHGFPETLVYCVWALTMIVPAIAALVSSGWKIQTDRRSVIHGLLIGLLGAGGQMVLFYAVTIGPPYLIFPIISLSPVVTIGLSFLLLGERTNWIGLIGIVLALMALPLFDFSPGGLGAGPRIGWFALSMVVMAAWGLQAYFMKVANNTTSAESIFVYMTLSGLILAPVAFLMTNFSKPINWGLDGPYLAAGIQLLNAVGALTLVHAFRHGKAIVIAPLTNAGAPLITAVLSLALLGQIPSSLKIVGIVLATAAALLLALAPEEASVAATTPVE